MGDRTNLQCTIYDCPSEQVGEVLDVLEGYALDEDWGIRSASTLKELKLGEAYVANEASCGSSDELSSALDDIPGVAYECWEDPAYDWLGSLNINVPGIGTFTAECDANGQPQFTSDVIIKKITRPDVTIDELKGWLGLPHQEALAQLAETNKGVILPRPPDVEIFARLSKQGTACAETALCTLHVDRAAEFPGDPTSSEDDRPVTEPVDCSENDELRCQVCGRKAS